MTGFALPDFEGLTPGVFFCIFLLAPAGGFQSMASLRGWGQHRPLPHVTLQGVLPSTIAAQVLEPQGGEWGSF